MDTPGDDVVPRREADSWFLCVNIEARMSIPETFADVSIAEIDEDALHKIHEVGVLGGDSVRGLPIDAGLADGGDDDLAADSPYIRGT